MTKERVATVTAAIGAGLLVATAGVHLGAYSSVVAQTPTDVRPLMSAAVQIAYLGFLPPTALLLFDALVLLVAGELGRAYQPRPVPREY